MDGYDCRSPSDKSLGYFRSSLPGLAKLLQPGRINAYAQAVIRNAEGEVRWIEARDGLNPNSEAEPCGANGARPSGRFSIRFDCRKSCGR